MKRALVVLILLHCALTDGKSQTPREEPRAIYAPKPQYPKDALWHGWAGSGIFLCKVRPDGTVASVTVLKSTGHPVLDEAGIAAFERWRFKPGPNAVKIPLNFSRKSGGVRSRMAGAALDRSY